MKIIPDPAIVRHLAASIIHRALLDLIYKDEQSPHWQSARMFFASGWFEDLADYPGFDPDQAKKAVERICADREKYKALLVAVKEGKPL